MDLNARVDVNCGRKDGQTDGRKTGRPYRTLLKQVRQKSLTPSPPTRQIFLLLDLESLQKITFRILCKRKCHLS